ncbi:uncharacterized protein I303_105812 [Kwoniella dejecticola CBS 10117]|uniref:Ataxin-10 homolog n=1 Tax=Kwoniella dejecticola CBS 10117 TaxID=1296121 RepID=A0A1A6A0F9_9TREE|nr:uncharacterized protein I303_05834 [Kwoniella dejecticola CBS 10117]OBR83554.1 hypothetical protein I303_05834 [Kwoniella dejecticola CBS 10117]
MDLSKLASGLLQGAEEIVRSDEACLDTAKTAEEAARYLARNLDERKELVDLEHEGYTLFDALSLSWTRLAQSFDPSQAASNDTKGWASEDSRIQLASALGKLERNLIAGIQPFQDIAEQHEEAIRALIFNITTFVRIEDERFFTLHAILAQLLCNLISPSSGQAGADRLADKYLRLYLSGGRNEDIIIRLLDSRDSKTNNATLHLLNNVVRGDRNRLQLLLSDIGVRWLAKILNRMDEWVEAQNGLFELGASIFNQMIDHSLHPKLFDLLSDPGEVITPSQTVLLKILDSHLSSSRSSAPSPSPHIFLIGLFHNLARYSKISIDSKADDPRLPKVFEGLILVTEGLSAVGLAVQSRKDQHRPSEGLEGDAELAWNMKDVEGGVVKPSIELLRSLDTFFPRLNPRVQSQSTGATIMPISDDLKPFSNLKRNIVQLLGILTFEDTLVGDQVREAEGIQLILGMTEIDENNPYLREHALLCVRNLMLNNPANQAIVSQMNPVGVLSPENGELLPVPDKMKKK